MNTRTAVVLGASLTQYTIIGLFVSSGLFFGSFAEEFGWSRAVLSGASALTVIVMGLLAVVAGQLNDRFGPRPVLAVTGLAYGVGYALMSQMTAAWQLFVIYGLFLGLGSASHDVVTLSTVARWFQARRGIMTAVIKVGTAVGQVTVPPVVALLVAGLGWRSAVLVLGITAAVLLLGAALMMRAPQAPQSPKAQDIPLSGASFAQARRSRVFWTLCAVQFLFFPTLMTLPLHLPAHGGDLGMTATRAALVISVMGGASILGRLAVGAAIDRIGGRLSYLLCLTVLIVALAPMTVVTGHGALFACVGVYGVAHGALFVVVSPSVAEYFGMRAHGAIFGAVLLCGTVGAAVGPILAGIVFDRTGAYTMAFVTLLVMNAAAFALILSLPKRGQAPHMAV